MHPICDTLDGGEDQHRRDDSGGTRIRQHCKSITSRQAYVQHTGVKRIFLESHQRSVAVLCVLNRKAALLKSTFYDGSKSIIVLDQ